MKLDTKSKLKRYIECENISSVLNNTKWDRLFKELQKIDFTLDFQRKDLDQSEPGPDDWDADLYHVMGAWEQIEWLNIRALISHPKGDLIKPEIENNTQLLINALQQSGIPYCIYHDGIRIWGYLRPGISPEWEST
ncbi:DUF6678 family protein [Photobacterium halotolerans]|uniref:Uncharacterized protein n=1 Tax=Photobacterium halotolerans TaxID=265726 RepID=A0A7X5AVB7_9GAMM|nr:DUF6678 family protein [Photobacterium halotolerans]NAW67276.1 hypothetical protein [Photobacterium halotolerans]